MDNSTEFRFNTSSILLSRVMENKITHLYYNLQMFYFGIQTTFYNLWILSIVKTCEKEDQQFNQNTVEHFEIYMVLINPIFEEKIPKVYILSQENLIWKTPRLKKKKKKSVHASYILNKRSKEHFPHIWKNKPCICFIHGINYMYVCCIFICLIYTYLSIRQE